MSGKKTTVRPIVCGTDFSATATEAVNIAAAMARRLETKLLLSYVHELYTSPVSHAVIVEAASLDQSAARKIEG